MNFLSGAAREGMFASSFIEGKMLDATIVTSFKSCKYVSQNKTIF